MKINSGQDIFSREFINDCLENAKEFLSYDKDGVVSKSVENARKEVAMLVREAHDKYLNTKDMTKSINEVKKRYKGDTIQFVNSKRKMRMDHYIKMQSRTAITKSRVETAKSYALANALDLFQVSAHDGAREKCYPYQGLLVSWSGKNGSFIGMDGKTYNYISINDTSYGEPDGLFGINCKHEPLPVEPEYFVDVISQSIPNVATNKAQIISLAKRRGTSIYK